MRKLNYFLAIYVLGIIFVLSGCSSAVSNGWQESTTFTIPIEFSDGVKGEYVLIGVEERIGFLVGSGKEGEAKTLPIIQGKVNKYMWHFWGIEEELKGNFKVVGIDEDGEEHKILQVNAGTPSVEKVWEYSSVGPPHNGADGHQASNMVFPTAGLWKLDVYVNEKPFGEIFVHVEPE